VTKKVVGVFVRFRAPLQLQLKTNVAALRLVCMFWCIQTQ
jgi:hypothetical protein